MDDCHGAILTPPPNNNNNNNVYFICFSFSSLIILWTLGQWWSAKNITNCLKVGYKYS